jgi:hypothetical protein
LPQILHAPMLSALVSTISYSLILILRPVLPGCVAAAYECHNE